jgi:cytochrome c oxidase cbb3-type subunit 3
MTPYRSRMASPDDVDYKDGIQEIDPVSGYDTTGHRWNGIRELNTPFPRIALVFLGLAFVYSVITWILLPAWPLGRTYTHGLLGLTQEGEAISGFVALEKARQSWMGRFDKPDFVVLAADKALLGDAMPAAERLFEDNCAACHGRNGTGGPGFPDLADGYWLWGGDPKAIAETISVGINSSDKNTRFSQMPAFDSLSHSDRDKLADYVTALPEGKASASMPGAALFADNCSPCHGDDAKGGLENGAPSLADHSVIYGQDRLTVLNTLAHGRQGVMPTWSNRLSNAEINLLALYVVQLGTKQQEQVK